VQECNEPCEKIKGQELKVKKEGSKKLESNDDELTFITTIKLQLQVYPELVEGHFCTAIILFTNPSLQSFQ
jgi:hypothetical protein